MSRPSSHGRIVSVNLLVVHLLGTTGCHSWHTQQGDVAGIVTLPARESPGAGPGEVPGLTAVQPPVTSKPDTLRHMRVTTPTRGTFELWKPRVANDSLFGQLVRNGTETGFPLAEVTSVQTRTSSAGKTVLLIGGLTALTIGLAVGIAGAGLCAGATDC